jgi:tetratricopeptide (TPR) repeat protein
MDRHELARHGGRLGHPPARGHRTMQPRLVGVFLVLGLLVGWALPGHAGQAAQPSSAKIALAVFPFTGQAALTGDGVLFAQALREAFEQVRSVRLVSVPQMEVAGERLGLHLGEPWSNADLLAVARDLQVRGLITGTVARQDSTLTVQARFVEASTGRVELGEPINDPGGADLRAPQQITAAALDWLQVRVTPMEAKRMRQVFGTEPVARDLYARYAQARWAQERGTRADHEHAIALLSTVLETAPRFAPAHLAMGRSWLVLDDPWRAWSAIRDALALDARLPDAHTQLGGVLMALPRRQYEVALRAYATALEFAPDDVAAWVGRADVRQALGQTEAAVEDYERAGTLDPTNAAVHLGLGKIYAAEPMLYHDAVAELRQAIALDPRLVEAHLSLGDLYEEKGLSQEAAEQYRYILSLDARHPGAAYGLAEVLERLDLPGAIAQWEQYLRLATTLPTEQDWVAIAQRHLEKLRGGGPPVSR